MIDVEVDVRRGCIGVESAASISFAASRPSTLGIRLGRPPAAAAVVVAVAAVVLEVVLEELVSLKLR